MTDVKMLQTDDGGEITIEGGNPILCAGFQTAAYLSLFGGDQRDDGTEATQRFQWWGNTIETVPARIYRSETQNLLLGISNVPANLLRIEEAAGRDLQWFTDEGIADEVEVSASVPALNTLNLVVSIRLGESEYTCEIQVCNLQRTIEVT